MSQPPSTQLPSGPRVPDPATRQGEALEPNARIESVPPNLRDVPREVRLRGEVEAVSADGRVTIRTPEGPVEIQIRDVRVLRRLQAGQTVEIRIAAGAPPRQAEISVPQRETPPERTEAELPRPIVTPVQIEIEPRSEQAPRTDPPVTAPPRLSPDAPLPVQIIRAEAVGLAEILPFLTRPALIIPAEIPAEILSAQITLPPPNLQTADLAFQLPAPVAEPLPEPAFFTPRDPLPAPLFPALTDAAPALPPQPVSLPEILVTPLAVPPPQESFFNPASPVLTQLPVPLQKGIFLTVSSAAFPAPDIPDISAPALPPLSIPALVPENAVLNSAIKISVRSKLAVLVASTGEAQPIFTPPGEPVENVWETILPGDVPLLLQNVKTGAVPATLIAQTPGKLPVFAVTVRQGSAPQIFILHTPFEPIVPGTQITFIPLPAQTDIIAASLTPRSLPSHPAAYLTPEPWPLLTEIVQTLEQIQAQPASALNAARMIPSPANAAQIGPAALFFIAAIRAGDISGWLGQKNVDAIRRAGGGPLLSRLTQEGQALSRLNAEPLAQEWRTLALPFMQESEVHKMILHYKQDRSGEGSEGQKGEKQTRFIFDLKFPQMGAVQMDGLFRAGRLDVILRTEQNFSSAMQSEMRRIYADALRQTNITGELEFQSRAQGWVKITPDQRQASMSV